MAIQKYENFVLAIREDDPDPEGNQVLAVEVFRSPAGESPPTLVKMSPDLTRALGRLERRALSMREIMDLGEGLSDLLLPPPARELFFRSLDRLERGQGLRLRLRLAPTLVSIPWEYAYMQRGGGERDSTGFLALDPRVSIVRHEPIPVPGEIDTSPKTRHLLVALASPVGNGFDRLDLSQEVNNLRKALEGVPGITADYLEGAGAQTLGERLIEGADIFHFAGHGVFDPTGLGSTLGSIVGEGSIVLEGLDGRPALMPADQLAVNLRGRGVQLVVLGACQTGRRDGENVWSGVVAALMEAGIPAAVGMQYKIWDDAAIAFSSSFYRALAAGLPLDQAVTAGRMAVFNLCHPLREDPHLGSFWQDWGVPVLYLRAEREFVLPAIADQDQREDLVLDHQTIIEPHRRTRKRLHEESRRLDAAMPGQVARDRPTEVWVQICMPDSEGFRGDLPQQTKTGDEISQEDVRGSNLSVAFPIDESSSEPLPLQLRVTVRAPDFSVTQPHQDIQLHAGRDSGLLTFNLTPTRAGQRGIVHVSVSQETDEGDWVTLGSAALSTQVAPTGVGLLAEALWTVISLPLSSLKAGPRREAPPPRDRALRSAMRGGVDFSMGLPSGIPREALNTRFLAIPPSITPEEILRTLLWFPSDRRMGWHLLIQLADGQFAVVSINDLDLASATHGEVIWDRPLGEVTDLLAPSRVVERSAQDEREAALLALDSPRERLVVLEEGKPAGLYIRKRRLMAGQRGPFLDRLFGQDLPGGEIPPAVGVLCPEDGVIYPLAQLWDRAAARIVCPSGHVIEP